MPLQASVIGPAEILVFVGIVVAIVIAGRIHRALDRTAGGGPGSDPPQKPSSIADELAKLAILRDRGAITQEEFEAQKRQLLA